MSSDSSSSSSTSSVDSTTRVNADATLSETASLHADPTSRPNPWLRFTSAVDARMTSYFYHHGRFVANRPWLTILGVCVVTVVLSLGLLMFESETRPNRLFAPQTTRAVSDQKVFRDFFGSTEANGGTVIVTTRDKSNLLTAARYQELMTFHEDMLAWSTEHTFADGTKKVISFNDVCKRENGLCEVDSPLSYVNYTRANVVSDAQIRSVVSQPRAVGPRGEILIYEVLSSGVPDAERATGQYTYTEAYVFRYFAQPTKEGESWEENWPNAIPAIEKKLRDAGSELKFTFIMTGSLETELNRATSGDIQLFAITFALMITFAILVMGSPFSTDIISNQALLAHVGILSVGLAIVSALGLGFYMQFKFNSTVGVLPFLILGIGVDDMFIIAAAYARTQERDDSGKLREVADRVAQALAEAGVSITMTSITDFLAFAIGASSAFPAIRNFALFAMLAVLLDYLYQVTFFVAFLALDGRRQRAHRASIPPFWKVSRDSTCCHRPHLRDADDHALSTLVKEKLGPALMTNWVRYTVVVVFIALLGVSIYGVTQLKEGLKLETLAPDDSYLQPFFVDNEEYFARGPVASIVAHGNIDWSVQTTRDLFLTLHKEAAASSAASGFLIRSWPQAFAEFALTVKGVTTVAESDFRPYLAEFLRSDRYVAYEEDLVFANGDVNGGAILATRVLIQHSKTEIGSPAQGRQMKELRSIVDKSEYDILEQRFIYADDEYIFFEQFLIIADQVLLNLGVALVGVAIVTFVLLVHPGAAVLTLVVVVMIDIDLLGLMHFWGVRLDSIALINLVLSIGFSVDFCAHIAHSFMVMSGDKVSRAIQSLAEMGSSVSAGGMSTFVGVLVLGFAKSAIFRIFFKMFVLILLLGLAHGLIFVPVVLSFLGPKPGRAHDHVEGLVAENENITHVFELASDGSTPRLKSITVGSSTSSDVSSSQTYPSTSGTTESTTVASSS